MKRKIVNYVIVGGKSYNVSTCVAETKKHVEEGYEPLGAPFIEDGNILQAMVKYKEDEK